MERKPKASAKSELLNWLDRKDRTASECRRHLAKKDYPAEEIEQTVEWVIGRGFVNDQSYAARYLEGPASRRGYSAAQASAKLMRLGIDRQIIRQALGNRTDQDLEAALRLLGRQRARLKNPELLRKAIAGLRRRGFSFGIIQSALKQMGSSAEDLGEETEEWTG